MKYHGVDLSHFQSGLVINWETAKTSKRGHVRFLYHKATEGVTYVDSAYAARRAEAREHGVKFGGYHYAHPTAGNAQAEAEWFLKNADPVKGDLLPALDLEVNEHALTREELTRWVKTWFDAVFAHTGVREGVLYTHYDLNSVPGRVFLWVPRYSDSNRKPVIPVPFKRYTIWQFADGINGDPHVVDGVGAVDINRLHWLDRRKIPFVLRSKPKKHKPKAIVVQPAGKAKRTYVHVKSGDTFNGIAGTARLDQSRLLALNPDITDPNRIYIGQRIRVA